MSNTIAITTQQNFYGIDTDILLKLVQDINPKITNISHEVLNYTYSDRKDIDIEIANNLKHRKEIVEAINEFFHYSADRDNKGLIQAHYNEYARKDIIKALKEYIKNIPEDKSIVMNGEKHLNRNIKDILKMNIQNFEMPHSEFFFDECDKIYNQYIDGSYDGGIYLQFFVDDSWDFASQENEDEVRINIKKLVENLIFNFDYIVKPIEDYIHQSRHDEYSDRIIDIIDEIHEEKIKNQHEENEHAAIMHILTGEPK